MFLPVQDFVCFFMWVLGVFFVVVVNIFLLLNKFCRRQSTDLVAIVQARIIYTQIGMLSFTHLCAVIFKGIHNDDEKVIYKCFYSDLTSAQV